MLMCLRGLYRSGSVEIYHSQYATSCIVVYIYKEKIEGLPCAFPVCLSLRVISSEMNMPVYNYYHVEL